MMMPSSSSSPSSSLAATLFLVAVVGCFAAHEPIVTKDFNYSYYLMQHAEDQPHREGWVKVCQRHCHLDGGMGIHKDMVSACGPYVHEMPKPKIHNYCRDGFKSGLEFGCHTTCTGQRSKHGHAHGDQHAGHECKSYKQQVPKPTSYEACIRGVTAGDRAARSFSSKLQTEWDYKMKNFVDAGIETEQQLQDEMEVEAQIDEAQAHHSGDTGTQPSAETAVPASAEEDLNAAREAARAAYADTDDKAESEAPADSEEEETMDF